MRRLRHALRIGRDAHHDTQLLESVVFIVGALVDRWFQNARQLVHSALRTTNAINANGLVNESGLSRIGGGRKLRAGLDHMNARLVEGADHARWRGENLTSCVIIVRVGTKHEKRRRRR